MANEKKNEQTGAALALRPTEWLSRQERVLNDYLPPGVDTRRFLAGAALAIADDTRLSEALATDTGRRSLISALCRAARVGLSLNPQDKQAGLIAYKGEIQYMIYAQGLIADAIRSGAIREVRSLVIYQADKLALGSTETGDTYTLETGLDDRGAIRGFLAVARMEDGTIRTHYMSEAQVREWGERFGGRTRDGRPTPLWANSFEGAGQKTVVRQLLTKLHVRTVEDMLEEGIDAPPVTVIDDRQGTSPADLSRVLDARQGRDAVLPDDTAGTGNTADLPFGEEGR